MGVCSLADEIHKQGHHSLSIDSLVSIEKDKTKNILIETHRGGLNQDVGNRKALGRQTPPGSSGPFFLCSLGMASGVAGLPVSFKTCEEGSLFSVHLTGVKVKFR